MIPLVRHLCFLLCFLSPFVGLAQKLKINGATIYVSDKTKPILDFGHNISNVTYDESNYDNPIEDSRITLKAKKGNPPESTLLVIDEKKNQFLFKVVFVADKKFTPYISLTNEEEITKFLAEQQSTPSTEKPAVEKVQSPPSKQEPAQEQKVTEQANTNQSQGEDKVLDIKDEELNDYIKKLVDYFYKNCSNIHNDKANAQTYIKRIMERVFNNCDSCVVQTISKKEKIPVPLKIPAYLNRLKILPYKKIDITAENITLASNIRKAEDGKYYATISILQKFQGYSGNELRRTYEDRTVKTSEVEIVIFDEMEAGIVKQKWRAYLRDIKATEIQD